MGKGYARGKGRMRRAYLKPYMGKKPSAGNPNTDYTREARARAELNDFKLAQLLTISKFPPNVPRKEALEHAKRMRNGRDDVYNHILMTPNNENHKVFMFWEIDHSHYYFLEVNLKECFMRKSAGYPSRSLAQSEFTGRRVRWVDCIVFPTDALASSVPPPL